MTVTAFQTNTETKLAQMAADLLALTATFDDAASDNENAQLLTVFYALMTAIRARQRHAVTTGTGTKRDRIFEMAGAHTQFAIMHLASMHEEIYNELYALFNSVDDPANDSIWGTNLLTNGTGPVNGPVA